MADGFTGGDALGLYRTGADGTDGFRYSEAVDRLPGLFLRDIPSLRVEMASGRNGAGRGIIQATGADALAYKAPGDATFGASVTIAAGETKVLESATAAKWVRVTRLNSDALGGIMTCDWIYERSATFPEVLRAAGADLYAQWMLHNHSEAGVSNVKVWIGTLGDSVVSDGGQLGASGAGSITTTGSFDDEDWPAQGWCRIEDSGGTLRENVFYTSRTATVLTVPAAGRGLLGTSAAAGASTDVIYPVPGMRVGIEAPGAEGTIQAATGSAPGSVTFTTGITADTGASAGSIGELENYGVWSHVELPVDLLDGSTGITFKLRWQWDYDGETYWDEYVFENPVEETALAEYRVHVGEDAVPDWEGTPDGTGASLPVNVGVTLPGSGTKTLNVTVRERNAQGLIGLNTFYRTLVIDSAGDDVTPDLSELKDVTLTNIAGGEVDVVASYDRGADASPADKVWLYVTTDGTDPDPATDTPVELDVGLLLGASADVVFQHTLGPYAYGTDVRVIARTYRSSDTTESTSTTVLQTDVDTEVPAYVHGGIVVHGQAKGVARNAAEFSLETVFDATHNVRFIREPGLTEFRVGSTVVWRAMWPSAARARLWIPDALALDNTTISGASGSDPVDVVSATEIYLAHAGTRRVKIDLSANTIEADTLELWDPDVTDVVKRATHHVASTLTVFQVWDLEEGRWRPYLEVTNGGVFRAAIPVSQRSG